jgi:hypothetical protein
VVNLYPFDAGEIGGRRGNVLGGGGHGGVYSAIRCAL